MTPTQRVWAAASRAVRTPSLIDRGLYVEYPLAALPAAARTQARTIVAGDVVASRGDADRRESIGNPDFSNEHLVNTEAGYRLQRRLDLVSGRSRVLGALHDDLQTFEPLPPSFEISGGAPRMRLLTRYENRMRADTLGAEISSRVQLRDGWQVDGAFSAFRLTPHVNGSRDPSVPAYEGNAPSSQWRMHLAMPIFTRGQADVHLFQTGSLPQLAGRLVYATRYAWSGR